MADAVISAPAVQSTPAGYQVPAAQEIIVRSVRAVVNGTGAAGAFLPTLRLRAPSGVIVWQAPTSATVAAGASADVSWFPRVAAAAAASTAATTSWAYIRRTASFSATGNALTQINPDIANFYTTDTASFTTGTTGGVNGIVFKRFGHYQCFVACQQTGVVASSHYSLEVFQSGGIFLSERHQGGNVAVTTTGASAQEDTVVFMTGILTVDSSNVTVPTAPLIYEIQNDTATAVTIVSNYIYAVALDFVDAALG